MAALTRSFPPQQLPFGKKGDKWRRECVDWATDRTYANYETVRSSVRHKKINFDLVNGILHMSDFEKIIAPDKNNNIGYNPDNIQHYPIINSKLNLLVGEESKRIFEGRFVVTNPNAISEIERNKAKSLRARYIQFLEGPQQSQEQDEHELRDIKEYITYDWQDAREIRANAIYNHYDKELNMPMLFNSGFKDACVCGEEMYQCDIVSGEPTVRKLNPLKTHIFRSGYSNRIEDADIIVIEDYWSPGRVYDVFYDALTEKDRKYIEDMLEKQQDGDKTEENIIRDAFTVQFIGEEGVAVMNDDPMSIVDGGAIDSLAPYDMCGNIRVVQVYWKSRKKVLKVKSYDELTGDEIYTLYPEEHKIRPELGEEATEIWVNEAWEGTKIGDEVYVNVRPRPVQYNSISNPSRCHFGIVGSLYNINENRPFSLVDMMKQYNYLYDVIHDRLNKLIANNWGVIMRLDLSMVPDGWDIEKWLYYAREMNLAVTNSFNEGKVGAATGKLSGAINNQSGSGVINLDTGNAIQGHIQLLTFIKEEMAEVVGISRQREGSISNRETVGGVERATVQSAHITEWLFSVHNDVKKRVYECLIETAKEAMRGGSKKFEYILSDNSISLMDIDGDAFAECDYGLVCDYGNKAQALEQSIIQLAQSALQAQALDFSTIMRLYSSCSMAEKIRMVEKAEKELQQRQQEAQQQQQQAQQQLEQMKMQMQQMQFEHQERMNTENNETRIRVAEIAAQTKWVTTQMDDPEQFERELAEKQREHDDKMDMEQRKLDSENARHAEDNMLKASIANQQAAQQVADRSFDGYVKGMQEKNKMEANRASMAQKDRQMAMQSRQKENNNSSRK